ncbi:non-homologous end joining protein Ku [Rhizobium ruizarguesonis]
MPGQRAQWKGFITPATSESEKVRFHTLNRETGNRVVSQYIDSVTGKPVKDENEAKGYARGENDYVLLTDDDLDRPGHGEDDRHRQVS